MLLLHPIYCHCGPGGGNVKTDKLHIMCIVRCLLYLLHYLGISQHIIGLATCNNNLAKIHLIHVKKYKSQSRSGIYTSIEKGFWEWSKGPQLQYVVKRLIPKNNEAYPRTAFYDLWHWSFFIKDFARFSGANTCIWKPRKILHEKSTVLGLIPEPQILSSWIWW